MMGFILFGLEKGLFPLYLISKLSQEVEIWYADVVETIDMNFGGVNFLVLLHPYPPTLTTYYEK